MLWDILRCCLLTAALAALGCLCWARLLLPLRGRGVVPLVLGRGDGEGLEQDLRACLLLRHCGLLRTEIWILDRGLSPAGRALAERLCGLEAEIRLVEPGALPYSTF